MATPVAAAIADDEPVLPVDALYDILLRLPAKPLCRFRVVCSSWRSLLCDPTFIAAHAARHPSLLITVAIEDTDTDVQILDMSGNVVKRLKSGQRCFTTNMWTHHDLVCLKGKDGHHRVLDLATDTTSVLPPRPIQAVTVTKIYAVGWAAAAGEYKALTISVMGEEQVCLVVTIDGNHGWGWRERGSPRPGSTCEAEKWPSSGVSGVAYFLMMFGMGRGGWHDWIMMFDLELEAWRPASIRGPMEPDDEPIHHSDVKLVEVNGHLVASLVKPSCDTNVVELWFLMDPHQPLWSKQYTITLPTTIHCYESLGKPLQVLEDGRIVIWIWKYCPKYRGLPRVYDPRTETFMDGAVAASPRVVGGVYTGSILHIVTALLQKTTEHLVSQRHF